MSELTVARKMKAKGYTHVIQITTVRGNFGEPLYIKSVAQAGELLRDFRSDEKAHVSWSKTVDDFIKELEG